MPSDSPFSITLNGLRTLTVARLAREQRGTVHREQLLQRSWGETTIDRRIEEELLTLVWPATYAFGNADLTREGWLFEATLACGPGSHLVARGAASARGLLPSWSTIDVRPANRHGVSLRGIRAHRMDLRPEELDVFRGLPVTTLAFTALDVAATEPADRVGKLLDEALLAGQYDHREMTELLAARRGCRGVKVLRDAVDGRRPRTRHPLSCRAAGLRRDRSGTPDLRSFGVDVLRVPDTLVVEDPNAFLALVSDQIALRSRFAPTGGGQMDLSVVGLRSRG